MAVFENYAQFSTKKVARTLELAVTELVALRQNTLTPDFILLALLGQPDAEPLHILERLLPNVAETALKLRSTIQAHYQVAVPRQGNQILVTEEINEMFRLAHEEARQLGDGFIATGTLFLALFDPLCGGVAERLR
ncbi:MAG: ATP-dependent Clp protease ATP-binding subunit, partial [Chromatiaceae bacterium]|nr:ATP-dependent Clp protease ATP-binding subunit [Chromatiaceae bacterium]